MSKSEGPDMQAMTLRALVVLLAATMSGGCGDDDDGEGEGEEGEGEEGEGEEGEGEEGEGEEGEGEEGEGEEGEGEGEGTIDLADADEPDVAPCPSQDILTTAADFDDLESALATGTITYLDIPYDGGDPDILKKKCGLEGYWDPATYTEEIPWGVPELSGLLMNGNSGICSEGFVNFGMDEGFPVAGTYRKELKVASGGATYHVRARITVSGPSAGAKFSDEGISVPDDIENGLVYTVDGTETAHGDLWGAIIGAMSASPGSLPTVRFEAKPDAAGDAMFTADVELICAASL